MSLHFRRSAGLEERLRWQAVASEIAEGLCKAVLFIGSIVAGIALGLVVAAMYVMEILLGIGAIARLP
ncbi:MAG TPA: hypothetical protein VM822_21400 [Pseudolabrys sp.]|jgi:hypothetical protein|nr:hypothetical protein [Pseudolabrys sp.]